MAYPTLRKGIPGGMAKDKAEKFLEDRHTTAERPSEHFDYATGFTCSENVPVKSVKSVIFIYWEECQGYGIAARYK